MSTFLHKDFGAGWCPSDSPLNGRKNGLLRMDCLELDQNGDLVMCGGTLTNHSGFTGDAHTLYSKFIGAGTPYSYVADDSGRLYRNTTVLDTGGSTSRAAFVAAFDYVLMFSGSKRKRDDGTTATNLGLTTPAAPAAVLNGAGVLTGVYTYIQLEVFANGAYRAKSAPSPATAAIVTAGHKIQITPVNPTSPANEVWIFRQGEDLDQYYRVKRVLSSYTTPFDDNVEDEYALEEGVTLSILALSVNSTNLPDDIIGAEGPINGRILLCTKNTLFFTETNSPETYVPGQGIPYSTNSTSGAEIFLWIKMVADNTILIGTTKNIYIVTGTFITLPDGTLDVYLKPLGTKYPPIDMYCDKINSGVVYMSHAGWTIMYPSGEYQLLIDNRLDTLYRGNTIAAAATSDSGVPVYLFPNLGPGGAILRYSCAVSRNKIYCRMPSITGNNPASVFGSIAHVYDFERKYWRAMISPPDLFHAQEDGALVGYYYSNNTLRYYDYQFAKTNDGTKQIIGLVFPVWDFESPRNRKDWETLKFKINTGGDNVAVAYSLDEGASFTTLSSTLNSATLLEKFLDLSGVTVGKSFQLKLTGQIANFVLSDISLDYAARPDQVTYIKRERIEYQGIDGHKFRPRTWPIIIDTLGSNVTFTPIFDGTDQSTTTLNCTGKTLLYVFFSSDATIPKSIGYKLSASTLFELYQVLTPEVVDVFPMPKRFDQLGPEHFFRYGKIKSMIVRLNSDSSANIPYTIYFQDTSSTTGNIAAIANKEDAYEVPLPAGTNGKILRVELGPTAFNFYRYYAQIQVAKSGRDSDMEWLTIGVPNNG